MVETNLFYYNRSDWTEITFGTRYNFDFENDPLEIKSTAADGSANTIELKWFSGWGSLPRYISNIIY